MATWNTAFNNAPADGDSPSQGDDRIRETRTQIYDRMIKSHEWGGSSVADGWHLEGSGRVYYAASEPTVRPDTSTSLDSDDDGRLYVDSDTKFPYVYTGSAFAALKGGMGVLFVGADEKSQNTDGGTFTQGAWQKRTINTEKTNSLSDCTLSNSVMYLGTGSYFAQWHTPAYRVGLHQSRLRDTTSGATLSIGQAAKSNTSNGDTTFSLGWCKFTLLSTSAIELQHYCETTNADDGFGYAANIGTEVYSQIALVEISA